MSPKSVPYPSSSSVLLEVPSTERALRHRVVVEDRHALARHLVAPAGAIRIGKALEVGVHLGRDVDDLARDAEAVAHRERVDLRLRIAAPIRHEDGDDVVRAQRRHRERGHQRGVDTTGEPDDDALEPHLAHSVGDEAAEQLDDEGGVNRERVGVGVDRSRRR